MQKPKPLATNLGRHLIENVKVPVPKPALETGGSRVIRAFIPPPTREQLMAGSANLRRVYKVEG